MQLNLEANEVQFLLSVLGELPSKTGAYLLIKKLEQQVQQPAEPPAAE